MNFSNEHLSDQQIKQTGSIYTPPNIVEKMMDMVSEEDWCDNDKSFCDPTCGVGNIIIPMLDNRVKHGINPTVALKTMYGNELVKETFEVLMENLNEWARQHDVTDDSWKKNFTNMDVFEWIRLQENEELDKFLE